MILYRLSADMAEWQTQQTQNLPVVTSCGFKSHYPHYRIRAVAQNIIYTIYIRMIGYCIYLLYNCAQGDGFLLLDKCVINIIIVLCQEWRGFGTAITTVINL